MEYSCATIVYEWFDSFYYLYSINLSMFDETAALKVSLSFGFFGPM